MAVAESTETFVGSPVKRKEDASLLRGTGSFVDNLTLLGRIDEAEAMFERLLSLRNDLGLLSEEYDAEDGRLVGNFPQAFSHIGLVSTALLLERAQREPLRGR